MVGWVKGWGEKVRVRETQGESVERGAHLHACEVAVDVGAEVLMGQFHALGVARRAAGVGSGGVGWGRVGLGGMVGWWAWVWAAGQPFKADQSRTWCR